MGSDARIQVTVPDLPWMSQKLQREEAARLAREQDEAEQQPEPEPEPKPIPEGMRNVDRVIPFGRYVVVETEVVKKVGNIILADESQERGSVGYVRRIGFWTSLRYRIKVGDRVIFSPYAGMQTILDGDRETPAHILHARDIIAKVRKGGA